MKTRVNTLPSVAAARSKSTALLSCIVIAISCALITTPGARALQVTFPAGGQGWVACKPNVLTWSAESTDPEYFSVELLNKNEQMLNGNFQIGNAIETKNGSALVTPNCIPPGGGYYLELVNASRYQKDKPQVFYTSPEFTIQPNSSTVPTPSGYSLKDNGTQLVSPAGATAVQQATTAAGTAESSSTPADNATNATTSMTSTNETAVNGPALVTPTTTNSTNHTATHGKNAAGMGAVQAAASSVPLCLASLLLASILAVVVI